LSALQYIVTKSRFEWNYDIKIYLHGFKNWIKVPNHNQKPIACIAHIFNSLG